jgi:hypothetical protein
MVPSTRADHRAQAEREASPTGREAILHTLELERYRLINRTRGGRPFRDSKSEALL